MKPYLAALILAALAPCLATAAPADPRPTNAPAAPCRSAVSTMAMEQCLSAAGRKADAALNATYTATMRALNPAQQARLKTAERLWVQFRDADCEAERGLFEGGTAAGPAYLSCREAHTRARTAQLKAAYA